MLIEVSSMPAYCMNVEAEVNRKPWYHDIKAYIKDSEYPLGHKQWEEVHQVHRVPILF